MEILDTQRIISQLLTGQPENTKRFLRNLSEYALANELKSFASAPDPVIIKKLPVDIAPEWTRYLLKLSVGDLAPHIINTFAWMHYRKKWVMHPLTVLYILQSKPDQTKIDWSLIRAVGGNSWSFLAYNLPGMKSYAIPRFNIPTAEEQQQSKKYLNENSDSFLAIMNKKNAIDPLFKEKKNKVLLQALSMANADDLIKSLDLEISEWIPFLIRIADKQPNWVKQWIQIALHQDQKQLLNGLYKYFLDANKDEHLGMMDLGPILFHLGPRHMEYTFETLSTPEICLNRWKSLLMLAKANYNVWPEKFFDRIFEVYTTIEKENKESADLWLQLSINRIVPNTYQVFGHGMLKHVKIKKHLDRIHMLEHLLQVRQDMMKGMK